jgi:hypothetical protein
MSVTAIFTKGGSDFIFSFLAGNSGYEMQDHRYIFNYWNLLPSILIQLLLLFQKI